MIQFRWMYTIEQIDELRHEWPRLLSHSPTRTVFQSIEWHLAWLQSFKHEYSPAFLTAWNGDSLVALAPLVSTTFKLLRIPITTYSFAGSANYASDYADFLYHDLSSLSSLLSFLMSAPPWQNLLLRNLPSSSPTKRVLLNHFTPWNHQWWDASRAIDTPTRIMHNDRQDQDILAKTLFKRKRKALEKLGRVSFSLHHSRDEIFALLPKLFEFHRSRWNTTLTPSQFNDSSEEDFYRSFVDRLSPLGVLHACSLSLDDSPIAIHLGFYDSSKFYWYKPAFNVQYASYSPGMLLFQDLFRSLLEEGCEEFDFTVGNESYKYQFSNTIRQNITVQATTLPSLAQYFRLRTGFVNLKRLVQKERG